MERIIGVNPVIEVLQNKEKNIEKNLFEKVYEKLKSERWNRYE